MALSETILVCLTERPMSGYDLAKFFDTSVGFFWNASHPQIYRELKKLEQRGHVASHREIQTGKPNKIVYEITSDGRSALYDWSKEAVSEPVFKDDLLVRLQAIEHVDKAALRVQIIQRLASARQRLDQYHHIRDRRFSEGAVEAPNLGKMMGLELGIEYENGWINWCESVLKRIEHFEA